MSLPSSPDSERAVLGAIMLDNSLIAQAVELLKPSDFYAPSHRRIFVAMKALFERGSAIDPILVAEELRRNNSLESAGGPVFLSDLTDYLPHTANISSYVTVIRETSTRRMVAKFADSLSAAAMADHGDLQVILARARRQIEEIAGNGNKRREGFSFTAVDDLLAEPKEDVVYVIDRMLRRGGFSILAAKPKIGKTTLSFALAVAVSSGQPFFGRETEQGKVLLLCLEEHRDEVAERLRRMGANGDNIVIHTGAAPEAALIALDAAIEELSPVLVIIDPLSRFVRVSDFNSYAEMSRQLEPLIDIARLSKCQTHILANHHNGKGGDLRDGIDATLGSTAISAAVDCLLTMRKREKVRTVESTQRHGENLPETIVHLDPETGIVSAFGDMNSFMLDERKKAVLDVVTNDPVSEIQIKELVGGTAGLTSKAVRALSDEGRLKRSGAGKKGDPFLYSLASVQPVSTAWPAGPSEKSDVTPAPEAIAGAA